MTRDVRVGRVLVAALQQAISEELPARTEFYDHWLAHDARRDGTLGLSPMVAVVGFLRTEGAGYYRVVTRAGRLVAEWTLGAGVTSGPSWWRSRRVCRRLTTLVASTCPGTAASVRLSRHVVTIEVRDSVFCGSREVPAAPLCAFYAALLIAAFASANLVVSGQMERCRAGAGVETKGMTCLGSFAVSSRS